MFFAYSTYTAKPILAHGVISQAVPPRRCAAAPDAAEMMKKKKDEDQKPIDQQIAELQRKFRVLENDKRAYSEDSQVILWCLVTAAGFISSALCCVRGLFGGKGLLIFMCFLILLFLCDDSKRTKLLLVRMG